jgi:hypothetical protein
MAIERFIWTDHAEDRCRRRLIDRDDLERAICHGHDERQPNPGEADWLVHGLTADGRCFVTVYDDLDQHTALIVSVWELKIQS